MWEWDLRGRVSELERRTDEIMDRVSAAGDDHGKRAAAIEEYLQFARAHENHPDAGGGFDVGPWTEDLADSYLALGRVEDAARVVSEATRERYTDDAEMLCDLAEKLMRSGHEAQARPLWEQARADFGGDVWVYVQAGIEYGDTGDHATALAWLTPGMQLALRTADPESALEQLVPLRASALSALGYPPDDLQARATQAEAGRSRRCRQEDGT